MSIKKGKIVWLKSDASFLKEINENSYLYNMIYVVLWDVLIKNIKCIY